METLITSKHKENLHSSESSSTNSSIYSSLINLFKIEENNLKMDEENNPPPSNKKIKLPIYNAASTENWFMMVDTVLQQHGINNELSKALEVLAVLPIETQDHIASLIALNPDDVYEQLKKKITDLNRPPYRQRMREFVSTIPMGDRKPTEYLLHLRKKLGIPTGTSEILDITFKEGLGENMRFALHSFEDDDINNYAKEADQIFHLRNNPTPSSVSNINNTPTHSTNALAETNATLVNRVLELERTLAASKAPTARDISSLQPANYQYPDPRKYQANQQCKNPQQPNDFQQPNNQQQYQETNNQRYNSNSYLNQQQNQPRYYGNLQQAKHYNQQLNNPLNNQQNRQPSYGPAEPRSWCRYHRKFGASAQRCEQQCSYPNVTSTPNHNYFSEKPARYKY